MKKIQRTPVIAKNNTAPFHGKINNIGLEHLPFRLEQNIYHRISICVTAASCIRHDVNFIVIKMKSGKMAKDEFFYRTNSIYKALDLIDDNLARSVKGLTDFTK